MHQIFQIYVNSVKFSHVLILVLFVKSSYLKMHIFKLIIQVHFMPILASACTMILVK